MQVGLCSSNNAVVCATIRVAGALLQALLLHKHLTVDAGSQKQITESTPSRIKAAATTQQQVQQLQSRNGQTPGHHQGCAAAGQQGAKPADPLQPQQQQKQHDQQGSESVDWLDNTHSSSSLLSGHLIGSTATGALTMQLPAATVVTSALNTADSNRTVDNGTTAALDAAVIAESLLSALLACASSSSVGSSSSACVDVRVGSLLELQQLMLLLADTQTGTLHAQDASTYISQASCAHHEVPHGSAAVYEQHQGGNNASKHIHPPALLGMGWLQEAVAVCMVALTHEDATLRR
jgi:hypothetical protein